jgi:hypothetical protein
MKKIVTIVLTMICMFGLVGCTAVGSKTNDVSSSSTSDYPAAIMVDGEIYLVSSEPMTGEVDDSAIIGYTISYTDAFPEKDGETNFNRELNMPYARVSDGIVVLYDNEWYLCSRKE